MNRKDLPALCKQLRRDIINMIANGASGHPGGSLSVIDMLVALYFGKMNLDPCEPVNPQRDRLVLSKGHAAPALYACLGELGLIEKEEYTTFRQLHSRLQGHPDRNKCPGVEVSTGSLGQGCSIATGMRWARRHVAIRAISTLFWEMENARKGLYGRRAWQPPITGLTT